VFFELGITILESMTRETLSNEVTKIKLEVIKKINLTATILITDFQDAMNAFARALHHLQYIPDHQPEWCVAEQSHHKMHEIQKKLAEEKFETI
jgi:hypothetical protein